jgi:hypothetical protein
MDDIDYDLDDGPGCDIVTGNVHGDANAGGIDVGDDDGYGDGFGYDNLLTPLCEEIET